MKKGILQAIAWALVVMLVLGMTAFATELPSGSYKLPIERILNSGENEDENPDEDDSEYTCGQEAHTHAEECFTDGVLTCEKVEHAHSENCLLKAYADEDEPELDVGTMIDLLQYLKDSGFNYSTSFTYKDGKEVEKNEDDQYVVEANQTYVFTLDAEEIEVFERDYFLQFPKNMNGIPSKGTLGLGVLGGNWTYDKETGLLVIHFNKHDKEVDIEGRFTITFLAGDEDLHFGDISVDVKIPEEKAGSKLVKAACYNIGSVPRDVLNLFNPAPVDDNETIVWNVVMTGTDETDVENAYQFLGGDVTDTITAGPHSFTDADKNRGIVMQVKVPDPEKEGAYLTYLVKIDESNGLSYESSTTWNFTLPAAGASVTTVDGQTIELLNSYKYTLYYTSTIYPPVDDRSAAVKFENKINAGREDSGSTDRTGSRYAHTGIYKSVSKNLDSTNPSISWTIKAEIPAWEAERDPQPDPVKGWYIEDTIRFVEESAGTVFNKLADPDSITITCAGKKVPHIDKATGTEDQPFAWSVEGNGKNGTVLLHLYHLHGGAGHSEDCKLEKNGYCTTWTEEDVVTFTIKYTYTAEDLEEIYGEEGIAEKIVRGEVSGLYNRAELHSEDGLYDVDDDSAGSTASFSDPLTKTPHSNNLDDDIMSYTIVVNAGHMVYSEKNFDLKIEDTMGVGLVLMPGTLVVKRESSTLTKDEDYTLDYKGTGEPENQSTFIVTIPTEGGKNYKYTIEYSAYVVRNPDNNNEPYSYELLNSVDVNLFGADISRFSSITATAELSGGLKTYKLTVNKTDNDGKPLEGAKFGFGDLDHLDAPMWDDYEVKGGTVVIEKDLDLERLMVHHEPYYITEVEAPEGYALSSEYHWFIYCRNGGKEANCKTCDEVITDLCKSVEGLDADDVKIYSAEPGSAGVIAETTIKNTPEATYAPSVVKNILGTLPDEAQEFVFSIDFADDNSEDAEKFVTLPDPNTVTVTGEGEATFGDIAFHKAGTYKFIITENTDGMPDYYDYDATEWELEVVIDELENGGLCFVSAAYTPYLEGEIAGDSSAEAATFTNLYTPGQITLPIEATKVITNVSAIHAGAEKPFSFIVELVDPDNGYGVLETPLYGEVKGAGDISFEKITFTQAGTYTFQIQEVSGSAKGYSYDTAPWTLEVVVVDNEHQLEIESSTYSRDGDTDDLATFTNVYTYGSLTVSKTVTGAGGDTTRTFAFTVTLDDTTINGTYGDMTFTNGVASFRLRHGQSVTATQLPSGVNYSVTETDNAGYNVTRTGNTGVITDGTTSTAAFTNVFIPTPTPEPSVTPEPSETPEPTPTPEPSFVNVSGSKTWNDGDNASGTRPNSIVVRLMQNGTVIDQRTVTAADGWNYSFDNLPEMDEDGNPYVYSVNEQMVGGYYSSVDGYNLTNTFVPDRPTGYRSRTTSGFVVTGLSVEELEDLITLFDYGTPLWGGLLGTGDAMPIYPFVSMGIGGAALIALLALSLRKRRIVK